MFFKRKAKAIFNSRETSLIIKTIKEAEQKTSGEIRLFIEHRCRFVNATDRAIEIFNQLQMQKTTERNAVLIYVATKDKQIAIWGDEGIHTKVEDVFWNKLVYNAITNFNTNNLVQGITDIITQIGKALQTYFPYKGNKDQNELSNDIAYGN